MTALYASRAVDLGFPAAQVYSPLLPSAMPPPPPSASPHSVSKSQPIMRYNRPSSRQHDLAEEDPKNKAECSVRRPEAVRRALNAIDANTSVPQTYNPSASVSTSVLGGKQAVPISGVSYQTAIPRAPKEPDVFAPEQPASRLDMASATQSLKRRLSMSTSLSAKRRKETLGDASAALNADMKLASESEQERWKARWVKSFPSLIIHFEFGSEEGSSKGLRNRASRLGAKIEQFFSAKVTHLIVKSLPSPSKSKPTKRKDAGMESPNNPFVDRTGITDLAQKAEALGIKVWTAKKLADILDRLSPVNQAVARSNSLHTLLEEEKIHGTRERDVNAPRKGYHYFKPGNKYLLVEDATAKHRTILVKEYDSLSKTESGLPILHETFLVPGSAASLDVPVDQIRERAIALYVERKPWCGEQPPGELQRSTSLREITGTPKLPDAQPYHNASGNSVVVTSNTASTSTANQSPAIVNGVAQLGAIRGKALMQISKRVQVLKENAGRFRPPGHDTVVQRNSIAAAVFREPSPRRISTGTIVKSRHEPRTFMSQDQVIRMLQQARLPAPIDHKITIEQQVTNRERVEEGLKCKEQDTSAGFCENCRFRYPNLALHLESRKHRRFARDSMNFVSLDKLIRSLARPRNWHTVLDSVEDAQSAAFTVCHEDHEKDSDCALCVDLTETPQEDDAADEEDEYNEEDGGEESFSSSQSSSASR